jgi:sugar (pentulose or hexulose) kinase
LAFFPAGIATRYFAEQFCGEDRLEAERLNRPFLPYLDERTLAVCPGSSGVFFTPHLIGSCNPDWDVMATGAICGLTPGVTRHHLRKALYEGIACELSRNLEALEEASGTIGDLRIGGNNAKAPFTVQMRADFTGKTLLVPRTTETVSLGAALLAGVASGVYSDCAQAAAQAVSIANRFLPDEASHRKAAEYRRGYEQFYRALAPMRERAAQGILES